MAVQVDQAKLVLNSFAAIFQNALRSADLVTWNQYSGEMNDRDAFTVSEQVGPRYTVTETVNGVADLTAGVQDTVFGSEQFTVNRTFGTSMGWSDWQAIRDIDTARQNVALKNAAIQLAEKIDKHVLDTISTASNNWVTTTPAGGISDFGDMAAGFTRLMEEGVDESDLRSMLAYQDREALSNTIVAYPATDSLSTTNFRKGFEGEINGIPTAFTQQLPLLTTGTRTNGAINGANQNVNYKAVSTSAAPGQYMSQTIAIDGLGANATVKKGEVFTVANVFAYDNRAQQSLGRLSQHVVVADATADGTGAIAALRVFPAFIVPGSGSGGDVNVNTAHATVTAAPADNAVVTFVGTAATAYKPRFIIQKQAVVVNTKDLIMPATGEASRKSLSKIPVSVRMWRDSSFDKGDHRVRFDIALTANLRDRRRIVRINQS